MKREACGFQDLMTCGWDYGEQVFDLECVSLS